MGLMVLLLAGGVQGSTINGNLHDTQGNAFATNALFTPLSTPMPDGTVLIASTQTNVIASAGGTFSVLLKQGNYRVTVGNNPKDSFVIAVPNDSAVYDLTALISSALTYRFPVSPIFELKINKGATNGYAALNSIGQVPIAQLGTNGTNALYVLITDGTNSYWGPSTASAYGYDGRQFVIVSSTVLLKSGVSLSNAVAWGTLTLPSGSTLWLTNGSINVLSSGIVKIGDNTGTAQLRMQYGAKITDETASEDWNFKTAAAGGGDVATVVRRSDVTNSSIGLIRAGANVTFTFDANGAVISAPAGGSPTNGLATINYVDVATNALATRLGASQNIAGAVNMDNLTVTNATTLKGAVQAQSTVNVTSGLNANSLNSTSTISGQAGLNVIGANVDNVTVTNATTLKGAVQAQAGLNVNGAHNVDNITVTNATTLKGAVQAQAGLNVNGAHNVDNITVTNATTLKGAVQAQAGLNVTSGLNANSLNSTSTISGQAGLNVIGANVDNVTVTNAATLKGAVQAQAGLNVNGAHNVDNITVTNATTLKGAAAFQGTVTNTAAENHGGLITNWANVVFQSAAEIRGTLTNGGAINFGGVLTQWLAATFKAGATFNSTGPSVASITLTGSTNGFNLASGAVAGFLLESDAAGNAFWGPGAYDSQMIYVDAVRGSDSTGVTNNWRRPFATFLGAAVAANSPLTQIVWMRPGTYTEGIFSGNVRSVFCEPGVKLNNPGGDGISKNADGLDFSVFGYARVRAGGAGINYGSGGPNYFTVEVTEVYGTNGTASYGGTGTNVLISKEAIIGGVSVGIFTTPGKCKLAIQAPEIGPIAAEGSNTTVIINSATLNAGANAGVAARFGATVFGCGRITAGSDAISARTNCNIFWVGPGDSDTDAALFVQGGGDVEIHGTFRAHSTTGKWQLAGSNAALLAGPNSGIPARIRIWGDLLGGQPIVCGANIVEVHGNVTATNYVPPNFWPYDFTAPNAANGENAYINPYYDPTGDMQTNWVNVAIAVVEQNAIVKVWGNVTTYSNSAIRIGAYATNAVVSVFDGDIASYDNTRDTALIHLQNGSIRLSNVRTISPVNGTNSMAATNGLRIAQIFANTVLDKPVSANVALSNGMAQVVNVLTTTQPLFIDGTDFTNTPVLSVAGTSGTTTNLIQWGTTNGQPQLSVTISVTNLFGTTNFAATLTINGSLRVITNNINPGANTNILSGTTAFAAATNIYNHFLSNQAPNQLSVAYGSSTSVVVTVFPSAALTEAHAGIWGVSTLTTNYVPGGQLLTGGVKGNGVVQTTVTNSGAMYDAIYTIALQRGNGTASTNVTTTTNSLWGALTKGSQTLDAGFCGQYVGSELVMDLDGEAWTGATPGQCLFVLRMGGGNPLLNRLFTPPVSMAGATWDAHFVMTILTNSATVGAIQSSGNLTFHVGNTNQFNAFTNVISFFNTTTNLVTDLVSTNGALTDSFLSRHAVLYMR